MAGLNEKEINIIFANPKLHNLISSQIKSTYDKTVEKEQALAYINKVINEVSGSNVTEFNKIKTTNYNSNALKQLIELGNEVGLTRGSFKTISEFQQAVIKLIVVKLAKDTGLVPYPIAYGIAKKESNFQMWRDVQSNKLLLNPSSGATGVMQLIARWHPTEFPNAAQYVKSNILAGLKYLNKLHKETSQGGYGIYGTFPGANTQLGNWERTIGGYYQGQGGVNESRLNSVINPYIKYVAKAAKEVS